MDLTAYLVTYDISSPKRWREVFRTMHGFGEHVQLSVFRCDLTPIRRAELESAVDGLIHHEEDQVLIVRIGPSDTIAEAVEVLGRHHDFDPPSSTIV